MKKLLPILLVIVSAQAFGGDCGPGYVLVDHAKIDGIRAMECQKLWCRDLETGRSMGSGDRAASGYVATPFPTELCDAKGTCIECFGERKWCSDETRGVWNPEYGAYTRGGADSAAYTSSLRSGCFTWQLRKPSCEAGLDAILQDGEWVCASSTGAGADLGRQSATRRTGTVRRTIGKIRR